MISSAVSKISILEKFDLFNNCQLPCHVLFVLLFFISKEGFLQGHCLGGG